MEYTLGKITLPTSKGHPGSEELEDETPLEERITAYIYDNLMGRQSTFKGPFGRKQVVYADLVSTGRSLKFLENFMMCEILPALSDSEAMTTVTGLQTMLYLDETRLVQCNSISLLLASNQNFTRKIVINILQNRRKAALAIKTLQIVEIQLFQTSSVWCYIFFLA